MISDTRGEKDWRPEWRALPRTRRWSLLGELRRGEEVRGPELALLTLREAQRSLRTAPLRAAAGVAGVLGGHLLVRTALGWSLTSTEILTLVLLGVAGLVWGSRSQRRALERGIAVNTAALAHWVEHGRMPGPGQPSAEDATRLLRIIEDEGWTRPHR